MNDLDKMDRTAQRIASALDNSCDQLESDITERLRFMRERALDNANFEGKAIKNLVTNQEVVLAGSGSLNSNEGTTRKWFVLGMIALIVLAASYYLKQTETTSSAKSSAAKAMQISTGYDAEFDAETAELVISDIPPQAYADKGFAHYATLIEDK